MFTGLRRAVVGVRAVRPCVSVRCISTAMPLAMPRNRAAEMEEEYDIEDLDDYEFNDHTTYGHHMLDQVRDIRGYLRRVKYEMPKFKGVYNDYFVEEWVNGMPGNCIPNRTGNATLTCYCTAIDYTSEYQPPKSNEILRFQTISHIGEEHPLDAKVVMTVRVSDLCRETGLDDAQCHKLLLLCGRRYNVETGTLRFSCERFPNRAQNKRYLSDTLDKLLVEAKDGADQFADISLEHTVGDRLQPKKRVQFPLDWLQPATPEAEQELKELRARQAASSSS